MNKYLLLILALTFVLRFWQVDMIPPGLTWDEASLGYNAYSLGTTLKDEYGDFLPLTLRSFGDYKPALYAYLTIPFVLTLGLTELAVRLPSVLAGTLIVITGYFLITELFKDKKLALFSSLAMAVSPFLIQFSRAGFEANVALLLNLLGLFYFLKGIRTAKFYFLSFLFFGLSLITYQSSRLFVPMLVLGLIVLHWKVIRFNRQFLTAGLLFLIFSVILGGSLILGGQTDRLETNSLFAYTRSDSQIENIGKEDGMQTSSLGFQILHGEWFAFTRTLVERYLIYFSPKTLFLDGDTSPRHSVPDLGMTYYFSLILMPLGLYYLLNSTSPLGLRVFGLWLLIAPIPATLARDLIQTLRALNFAFPLAVIEGAGLLVFWRYFWSKKVLGKIVLVGSLILVLFNFLIYFDRYYIHLPAETSQDWLSGYKQTVLELQSLTENKQYDSIIFSDAYGQPYIYYLFFAKYPPLNFQRQALLNQSGIDVGTVRKIDNIEFRHIYWPDDRSQKNSLVIGPLEELPDQDILPYTAFKILKEIKFPDGSIAFRIVETK